MPAVGDIELPDRVVVFFDYQNVYQGARRAFHGLTDPHWHGQADPVRLAKHLTADGPFDRELAQVRVYRGQPDGKLDPRGYAASRRQHAAWCRSSLVELTVRPLRYPQGWPERALAGEGPQEKGIDVALCLDFALMGERGEYDAGILFSTDTALELVADLTRRRGRPRAEVAAWSGPGQRNRRLSIKTRNLYCHWIGEDIYRAVADRTDYSRPG
ncbi:MAG: NYN domain-containing protein [Nocardioidaceae bacterium]